jgi:FkbM family methyltransferase
MIKKIKNFARGLIEKISRMKNTGSLFGFSYGGRKILFYLPLKGDHIQQQIIVKRNFYEELLLRKAKKYLVDKEIILDIGSNIGNHSIFFKLICNAKKVYSFEPQRDIFRILERNLKLNGVYKKENVFNIGLGNKDSKGKIISSKKGNCGGTKIESNKMGDLEIRTLDGLGIKGKVDFIKIDTEGFEKEVLVGGTKTIKENKPVVWVEINHKNKAFVFNFFKKRGYSRFIDLGDKENYLFLF